MTPKTTVDSSHGTGVAVSDIYDIGFPVSENSCGSGGEVLNCKRRCDGLDFAVKKISKRRSWEGKGQILVMEQLEHSNIVQLVDWFEDQNNIFVVMELARGGDLFDRIMKTGRISERDAALAFRQILMAVSHMHKKGFVHCDLKPENVLFCSASDDAIKLADFGFAQNLVEGARVLRHQGTYSYSAPEIIDEKEFDFAADMWSLGVLLYAMLAGFAPFGQGSNKARVAPKIRQGHLNFNHAVFKNVSSDAVDLIRKLVVVSPTHRISAEDALRHPWLVNQANSDAAPKTVSFDASTLGVCLESSPPEEAMDCVMTSSLSELNLLALS